MSFLTVIFIEYNHLLTTVTTSIQNLSYSLVTFWLCFPSHANNVLNAPSDICRCQLVVEINSNQIKAHRAANAQNGFGAHTAHEGAKISAYLDDPIGNRCFQLGNSHFFGNLLNGQPWNVPVFPAMISLLCVTLGMINFLSALRIANERISVTTDNPPKFVQIQTPHFRKCMPKTDVWLTLRLEASIISVKQLPICYESESQCRYCCVKKISQTREDIYWSMHVVANTVSPRGVFSLQAWRKVPNSKYSRFSMHHASLFVSKENMHIFHLLSSLNVSMFILPNLLRQ